MAHRYDSNCEHRVRLDAVAAQLEASAALLMKSAFSGSDDAIELAYAALRVAKVKLTSARAVCREHCQVRDLQASGLALK